MNVRSKGVPTPPVDSTPTPPTWTEVMKLQIAGLKKQRDAINEAIHDAEEAIRAMSAVREPTRSTLERLLAPKSYNPQQVRK